MKLRLDKVLVDRKLAETRTRAQERIRSGQVIVDGKAITKTGWLVDSCQFIEIRGEALAFVSRGGLKLAAALDYWKIDLTGRVCLDIGISTGGFSDCMLQRGAKSILGIDSGYAQLAVKLRTDPRLQILERTNARHLTPSLLPREISFFAMDVSFIAATLVLPAVIASAFRQKLETFSAHPREAVVLVKPQFEGGREFVGKGGIVRSEMAHQRAIERVRQTVCEHGAVSTDVIQAPISGGDGNQEFLLYARF